MLGEWDEGLVLSQRDGVELLVEELRAGEVELATVGMQSNLAAALERDPGLVGLIPRVAVMGGLFARARTLGYELPATIDHNLNVDREASLRSLNAGLRLVYTPCDVTMDLWLMRKHLDALRVGNALCRELARQIDIWRRDEGRLPDDYACRLHDALAVGTMVERSFVRTEVLPVTVARVGNHVRTFVDPLEGRDAEVVRSVDAERFSDWWLDSVRS
jgi:purine nucleosidase